MFDYTKDKFKCLITRTEEIEATRKYYAEKYKDI